jgi:hypothetical protein
VLLGIGILETSNNFQQLGVILFGFEPNFLWIANAQLLNIEKIFSRTSRPISIKLGTNHPWVKEILDYTNKGPGPFQRGDNHKKCKNLARSLKRFLLQNHWARIAHIFMKAFWDSANLSLYKLWSPRVKVGDTRGGTIFTFVYWKESFKMKHQANFNQTWNKHFLHDWNSDLFKWRFKSSSKGENHKNAKIG